MLDTDRPRQQYLGQTWGRRLQDCNGAALVGGQFPDKFSTEGWHCLEDRVHRRGVTDEMTDT
jgi:hypothetical protein